MQLDGSNSSDADGDTLTFSWVFESTPTGSGASLSNANQAQPSFQPDLDGEYRVALVVSDGKVDSIVDRVVVTASTPNSTPIASAGPDQSALVGDVIRLDGTGSSDADNDSLAFAWSFTSRPDGSTVTLSSQTIAQPEFTPDVEGTYVVSLVVSDAQTSSEPDAVMVTVTAPVIKLSRDQGFLSGFAEVAFPYQSTSVTSRTVNGVPAPTSVELDSFRISAEGGDFTLINLRAVDQTGVVSPEIDGLTESFVLLEGETKEFRLISPLTNGNTVQLVFEFEVQETGDTFSASYSLTTN